MEGITALVSWPSAPLTESLVRRSLDALKSSSLFVVSSIIPPSFSFLLQWSDYDSMDHEMSHSDYDKVLSSSYTIRKALIRKHFLSRCVYSYLTKHDRSPLKLAIPRTWDLEISYADELDEMWTDELWDLGEELEISEKWFIVKPGMADRGMGIRLFNSKEALQHIFEEFEDDSESSEAETNDTAVVTSQLRHFVVQEYLLTPLLLDPHQVKIDPKLTHDELGSLRGHKFHLRAYVVASGAISLYLYPQVLALFSAVPYSVPISTDSVNDDSSHPVVDLTPHLTNTSLQTHRGDSEEGIRLLDELIGCSVFSTSNAVGSNSQHGLIFTADDVATIKDQMAIALSETFKAALEMPVHFQPLPNAFELYGVDFLVSHSGEAPPLGQSLGSRLSLQVKLLEINAEPAIELTGARLTWILEDLFVAIGKVCIAPLLPSKYMKSQGQDTAHTNWAVGETKDGLQKCLDFKVRGDSKR